MVYLHKEIFIFLQYFVKFYSPTFRGFYSTKTREQQEENTANEYGDQICDKRVCHKVSQCHKKESTGLSKTTGTAAYPGLFDNTKPPTQKSGMRMVRVFVQELKLLGLR